MVFAGQGAQSPGMGRDLYDGFDSARALYDAAEAVRPGVTAMCFGGPEAELNRTQNAQPCLFLTDLAYAAALSENGISVDGAAGFSLGEIPAMRFANVMDFGAAFDFVCFRADVMGACASERAGVMLAVLKLTAEQVEELCRSAPDAWAVNYNCPGQTVVACAESSAQTLSEDAAKMGGKAVRLAVGGAFHSPYMEEASLQAARYLENVAVNPPSVPLYSNVTALPYGGGAEEIKDLLARQIRSPVLWRKTVENMAAAGFDTFIEAGPGKTLTGLIKKICPEARAFNVCDLKSLEEVKDKL